MKAQGHINIFIVDDNKLFSMTLKAAIETGFKDASITVRLFETGENCMEHFLATIPELVILDYSLNSMSPNAADGLKVLEKIKKNHPETSVIMLTSNENIEVALKSFHSGAADYVVKTASQFTKILYSISLLFEKKHLARQKKEKTKTAIDLLIATNGIAIQTEEKEKWAGELTLANNALDIQHIENQKRSAELILINRDNAETVKSKLAAEEKNKSITDSINYAKRIQQAKLPKKEEIYASFPDSFILFKPKDIVSGDFYFFHKNKASMLIAAADCTGHGVPGALMSMIGSEKLTDAASFSTDPSEILSRLNKGIKTSLRQSESRTSTKDGMDIALCHVNTKTRTVKFAGANRPIWIIRRTSEKVEEIKGTKKAIGGYTENDQHFLTHEITLQEGDIFYIFSDGYADTFGGEHGKKLMTRRFKEILLQIRHLPMAEQGIYLENFIELWKAGEEQVDDILVIGIRL